MIGRTLPAVFALLFAAPLWAAPAGQQTLFNFVRPADVVQVAINFTTSRMWWRKNDTGSWYGGTGTPGDPAAGTNGLNISALFPGSAAFPVFTANSSTPTGTIRLSQAQFSFSPPSGFSPWDASVRRNEAMIIG